MKLGQEEVCVRGNTRLGVDGTQRPVEVQSSKVEEV